MSQPNPYTDLQIALQNLVTSAQQIQGIVNYIVSEENKQNNNVPTQSKEEKNEDEKNIMEGGGGGDDEDINKDEEAFKLWSNKFRVKIQNDLKTVITSEWKRQNKKYNINLLNQEIKRRLPSKMKREWNDRSEDTKNVWRSKVVRSGGEDRETPIKKLSQENPVDVKKTLLIKKRMERRQKNNQISSIRGGEETATPTDDNAPLEEVTPLEDTTPLAVVADKGGVSKIKRPNKTVLNNGIKGRRVPSRDKKVNITSTIERDNDDDEIFIDESDGDSEYE